MSCQVKSSPVSRFMPCRCSHFSTPLFPSSPNLTKESCQDPSQVNGSFGPGSKSRHLTEVVGMTFGMERQLGTWTQVQVSSSFERGGLEGLFFMRTMMISLPGSFLITRREDILLPDRCLSWFLRPLCPQLIVVSMR